MKNQPVISHFDLGVFGTAEGPVIAYRRVYDDDLGNTVQSLSPSDPPRDDERFGVYQWDDDKAQWTWVSDHETAETAVAAAQHLAGTTESYPTN